MATLKVKNKNGDWEVVYAVAGPQGPKGDKGDTGAAGQTPTDYVKSVAANNSGSIVVTKGDGSTSSFAAGGVKDVSASSTAGYITITNADGTTKDVVVGTAGSYLPTSGGTVTGQLKVTNTTASSSTTTGALIVSGGVGVAGSVYAASVYGAVWNDYAEYREPIEPIAAGYCVTCDDDGRLYKTSERLQHCEGVVSDTFGFSIGETETATCPLAVAGRVLAYTDGSALYSGDAVCAAADGRVSKMSRDEIKEFPDRIVGIVSEIPNYKVWGTGNVDVDGRVWIKVR